MFYSKATYGFYDRAIHGDAIPSDAVEITAEQYLTLLEGQSAGKIITADENGYPVLSDRAAPSVDELAAASRTQRDALLTACDWVVVKAYEAGAAVPDDWAAYRQALRDVPDQSGFPAAINWPVSP